MDSDNCSVGFQTKAVCMTLKGFWVSYSSIILENGLKTSRVPQLLPFGPKLFRNQKTEESLTGLPLHLTPRIIHL